MMNLFHRIQHRNSAPVALQRLQVLLSHERVAIRQGDLLAVLRGEILDAIARHVTVDNDSVDVQVDRGAAVSTLEIEVQIPHAIACGPPAPARRC
jgi:cell division topological specificity factor